MLNEQDLKIFANGVDQVVRIPIGGKFYKWEKVPLIDTLYNAARKKTPNRNPLSYEAAKGIMENVKKGSVAFLLTGWYLPHFMSGETDGPPGAAALARALDLGFDVTPIIFTEPKLGPIVEASIKAVGLRVATSIEEAIKIPRRVAVITDFHPYLDVEDSIKLAKKYLDELKPTAVLAVEKGSRNKKDIYHSLWGIDISPLTGKLDRMVDEARERGIYTLGIGDGGNEIGLGGIRDAVEEYLPCGAKCYCPCGAGCAASTETDNMIVAYVSNWGAYGVEAVLAMMLDRNDVMHGEEVESAVLSEAAMAGAVASPYGYSGSVAVVDQIPQKLNVHIVDMLKYMVETYSDPNPRLREWYQESAKHQENMNQRIRDEYKDWKR